MTNDIKYMDITEFRNEGFLQEVNRQFFHPLGLALEVILDPNGKSKLGGIWDYRDDPEGNFFDNKTISKEHIKRVEDLKKSKITQRFLKAREYGTKINTQGIQQPLDKQ